jgi:serine phosphatase RsbU (regulator of sigma subunit)
MMSRIKEMSRFQVIGIVLLVIVAVNFIKGIVLAIRAQDWTSLYAKLVTLGVLVAVGFIYRESLKKGWDTLKKRREVARQEFEKSRGDIGIKEAAIFSLTWSQEIYRSIPLDRRRLVRSSFILIGIGMGVVMVQLDSYSLMTILLSTALILAGVNLLIWVVGSEREEKDRIQIELETARKMQMSLMPTQDPVVQGYDISGCCIPAQDVGGDLFDFIWSGRDRDKLCITVVDVSGKGMDAALTAVYTSGALISEAQHEDDVVTITRNLNSAIYSRQNRTLFVSIFMAWLDVTSRTIQYVNAGQTRPMLLRDRKVLVLKGPGARFPLGVMESPTYQASDIRLKPGDNLLLYTDGVTEAMNTEEEMFGEKRLKALFLDLTQKNIYAADMVKAIKQEIVDFSGSERQHDDLTIVVVRVA